MTKFTVNFHVSSLNRYILTYGDLFVRNHFNVFVIDFPKSAWNLNDWYLYYRGFRGQSPGSGYCVMLSQPSKEKLKNSEFAFNLDVNYRYLLGELKVEDGEWENIGEEIYRQRI